MNRENILFGLVGLLLGYVVAFHLVVHINKTHAEESAAARASASASGALPEGHPPAGGDAQETARLRAAADDSPKDFDAQLKAGEAYLDAGEFNDAADYLLRANALRPDDLNVRSELAVAYFMHDPPQHEKAVAELRRNLEADPNHLPSLHNLTRMLAELGRPDEARATLAKLEKVKPDYNRLAQLREEVERARPASSSPAAPAGGAKKSPTD